MSRTTKEHDDQPPHGQVYPIYLTRLDHVVAVVIGGGPIGERKIRGLLTGGAQVRLIAPQATPQLQQWAAAGQISWQPRPYQLGDLADAFLVIAATDVRGVNGAIAAEAKALNLLCNVADRAEEGNFHTPATLRVADEGIGDEPAIEMVIAIGSTGKAPRRVKAWLARMRDWL